jgi:hypothetical protein
LLRAEGVLADGNKVSMRTYRWDETKADDGPAGLFDM